MTKYRLYNIIGLCIGSLWHSVLMAQDVHFAQYRHAPMLLNPALAGLYDGTQRLGLSWRSQWASVPVNYMSAAMYYDTQLLPMKRRRGAMLGAGLIANYDKAGDSRLSNATLGTDLAVSLRLSPRIMLSGGVQASLNQRRFESSRLSFDNQWNGDLYDPARPAQEQFTQTAFIYADVSTGINAQYFAPDGSRFNFGVSAYHLGRPSQTFMSASNARLPIRRTSYLTYMRPIGTRASWGLHSLLHIQQSYREWLNGLEYTYHYDTHKGAETDLMFGLSYRVGDAVIPSVGLRYTNWQASFAYDINTSAFRTATMRRGGPEVHVQYIFRKPGVSLTTRHCPVF